MTDQGLESVYLVQRLEERVPPQAGKGVDRYFSMDYMGSAEFEYGALPRALRAIRADPTYPEWEPVKIQAGPHETWYVGNPGGLQRATEFFTSELARTWAGRSTKETTNLPEVYLGTSGRTPRTSGWWRVDEGKSNWALFRTEQQAKLWLRGLRGPEWERP